MCSCTLLAVLLLNFVVAAVQCVYTFVYLQSEKITRPGEALEIASVEAGSASGVSGQNACSFSYYSAHITLHVES